MVGNKGRHSGVGKMERIGKEVGGFGVVELLQIQCFCKGNFALKLEAS